MNWDVASQIATSLGALLAAGSLAAGFVLYRINQRDELAAQFRRMIGLTRPNLDQLGSMVSFELASELASTAVHSRDLAPPLEDLYEYCRPESGQKPDRDAVVAYLAKYFPAITVALNTPLVLQYQSLTTCVAADVALYQASFPGVYRVINSAVLKLESILYNEKTIARDEYRWKEILPGILEDDERISTLAHLKWMIAEILTTRMMEDLNESRKQIILLTKMIDLVFEIYLNKTASELKRISREERGEKVRPTSGTETISEDLQEAERCLRHAFDVTQRQRYRELLDEFEGSYKRGDDEQPDPSPAAASEGAAGAGSAQGQEEDHATADGHDSHLATDDVQS